MEKDDAGNQTKFSAVFAELRGNILGGRYAACRFPSERTLMRRFGVSRTLMRQVIAGLKVEGLLDSRQGQGTFIPLNAKRMNERLGFIIPGVGHEEIFSPICKRLISYSERRGFTPIFADLAGGSPRERHRLVDAAVKRFIAEQVAAVVYQPVDFLADSPKINAMFLARFKEMEIPVVLFDYDIVPRPDRSAFDLIGIDNYNAGWRLGRHLVEKGAKRIAFLMRDNWAFSVIDRRDGLHAAAEEARLKFEVTSVEPDDAKGVAALLGRRSAPDTVVCGNDLLAIALLKTLRAAGVKVPEDVMVAGFDDTRVAALSDPPLTTIHQPSDALARSLFEVLMIRIKNPDLPAVAMYHNAWLVPRDSTARKTLLQRASQYGITSCE